jgi:hypothetical protein
MRVKHWVFQRPPLTPSPGSAYLATKLSMILQPSR